MTLSEDEGVETVCGVLYQKYNQQRLQLSIVLSAVMNDQRTIRDSELLCS